MARLLKIEWNKILSYRTFWVLIGLHVILFLLISYVISDFTMKVNNQDVRVSDNVYQFPGVWHTITYIASYFTLILSVLIIILATNEYSYRTIRQNIIDGLSKPEYVSAKFLVILLLSIAATVFIIIMGLVYGLINSEEASANLIFEKAAFIPAFFLQTVGILSLAYLIATWMKKAGLAIGLFLLYWWVIEPLVSYFIKLKVSEKASEYFPAKYLNSLIENPWLKMVGMEIKEQPTTEQLILPLLYIAVFIGLSYLLIQKRDLK